MLVTLIIARQSSGPHVLSAFSFLFQPGFNKPKNQIDFTGSREFLTKRVSCIGLVAQNISR